MSLEDELVAQWVMEQKLDAYLSGLAQKKFSGTALVAQGGRVVLHKGYGLADKENRRLRDRDGVRHRFDHEAVYRRRHSETRNDGQTERL
jgi:hypothetical protein